MDALDSLGYESRYISRIMGSIYMLILLTTVGLIVMLLLLTIKSRLKWALTPFRKLKEILLWNYIIRLIFEVCIELTFVLIFNTTPHKKIIHSKNILEFLDHAYTILFNILICIGPAFIIIFYNFNFSYW